MKEELAAGIKNALERGSSLEEAMNSFIHAGYNPAEVREASQIASGGATSIAIQSHQNLIPAPEKALPPIPSSKSVKFTNWKVIAIIILIVVIGLGLLGIIFSNSLLAMLK